MENTDKTAVKQHLKHAYSAGEVLNMKKRYLQLEGKMHDIFGLVERTGVVLIWGNSGNGKTSFVMQFCRELARHGKVLYNSLEEGVSLSMQNTLKRYGINRLGSRFTIIDGEDSQQLSARLLRRKSADFIVIDSIQYFGMTYIEYKKFKQQHRDKLLIFVSHADGRLPSGRSAKSIMYDAMLKVWIEGYQAVSKGRFIGEKGYCDIWDEGAQKYGRIKNEQDKDIFEVLRAD